MSLGEEVLKYQGDLKTKKSQQHLTSCEGFPGGSAVKNLPANAGDMGSIPGLGTHLAYIPPLGKGSLPSPLDPSVF